jgi:TATA-box binding protein (TBP) (component of TFIID and TFIIIB)
MKPSPLKISTITATAKLDIATIDLDAYFNSIEIRKDPKSDGIERAEYCEKKGKEFRYKPEISPDDVLLNNVRNKNGTIRRGIPKIKKRFDNQMTVIVRHGDGAHKANVKVFRNGHIQITGLKTIENGMGVVRILIQSMKPVLQSEVRCTEYKIRLINSDFRLGFEVRRDMLQNVVSRAYGVPCSFEPCIYPGCKIQYWYNENKTKTDGRCTCTTRCDGKGGGYGDGRCKKVTIAVFHSGSVIVTGGQSMRQIDEAYDFVCRCIEENYDCVKRERPKVVTQMA